MKILIIEDQIHLAENILDYFTNEKIECEHAPTVQIAREKLKSSNFDIILLDIMLPDGNGLELLNQIKASNISSGVIIISAKNALDDRVSGLDLGADDYLTKPFHLSELNARVKSIYRRRNVLVNNKVEFENIVIDTDQREVYIDDEAVDFTIKEQELLLYFISNKNRVLTKQNIADYLWGDNVDFLDSFDFVYQHIKNIRKKIHGAGGPECIKTIYGLGYKLSVV
tara:strand:+ start:301 stop:978 length:678 start_codon:yes stop_codon:yes gene_type:complete